MASESRSRQRPTGNRALHCGAEGPEHGEVVGCCYICGLLLCEQHLFHQPRGGGFGRIDGQGATPLVCGRHAGAGARPGWPLPPSTAPQRRRKRSLFARHFASRPPRRRG